MVHCELYNLRSSLSRTYRTTSLFSAMGDWNDKRSPPPTYSLWTMNKKEPLHPDLGIMTP